MDWKRPCIVLVVQSVTRLFRNFNTVEPPHIGDNINSDPHESAVLSFILYIIEVVLFQRFSMY